MPKVQPPHYLDKFRNNWYYGYISRQEEENINVWYDSSKVEIVGVGGSSPDRRNKNLRILQVLLDKNHLPMPSVKNQEGHNPTVVKKLLQDISDYRLWLTRNSSSVQRENPPCLIQPELI